MLHLTLVIGAFGVFIPLVTALAAREYGRSGWRWFALGCVLQCGAAVALWWVLRDDGSRKAPGRRLRVVQGSGAGSGPGSLGGPTGRLRLVPSAE